MGLVRYGICTVLAHCHVIKSIPIKKRKRIKRSNLVSQVSVCDVRLCVVYTPRQQREAFYQRANETDEALLVPSLLPFSQRDPYCLINLLSPN